MKNIIPIVKVLFSLILGGMLVFAGIRKFDKLTPWPTEIIDTIKKEEELPPNTEMLKIKNYFFGMKQTNYFWEFLGFVEILAGVLLLNQFFYLFRAILALPVTINIFLFHLFLKPNEVGKLFQMLGLLVINLLLIGFSYKLWKPILINRNALKLS